MSVASPPHWLPLPQYLTDPDCTHRRLDRGLPPRASLSTGQSRCRITDYRLDGTRLTIDTEGERPAWFKRTVDRLNDFLRLPEDWDGYGAKPVNPRCVLEALRLVLDIIRADTPAPSFVPLALGGIQFEWHENGIDLEVEVRSPSELLVYCLDSQTGSEHELELSHNLSALVQFVDNLSRSPRLRSAG